MDVNSTRKEKMAHTREIHSIRAMPYGQRLDAAIKLAITNTKPKSETALKALKGEFVGVKGEVYNTFWAGLLSELGVDPRSEYTERHIRFHLRGFVKAKTKRHSEIAKFHAREAFLAILPALAAGAGEILIYGLKREDLSGRPFIFTKDLFRGIRDPDERIRVLADRTAEWLAQPAFHGFLQQTEEERMSREKDAREFVLSIMPDVEMAIRIADNTGLVKEAKFARALFEQLEMKIQPKASNLSPRS